MPKYTKANSKMPNKDKVDAYSGGVTGGWTKEKGEGVKSTVKASRLQKGKVDRRMSDSAKVYKDYK